MSLLLLKEHKHEKFVSTYSTGQYITQSTYKVSPPWIWDSPTPSPASDCAPAPGTKGGRTRVGGGVP
jgi:hypothetical protein